MKNEFKQLISNEDYQEIKNGYKKESLERVRKQLKSDVFVSKIKEISNDRTIIDYVEEELAKLTHTSEQKEEATTETDVFKEALNKRLGL